jgi:hypothetical protein
MPCLTRNIDIKPCETLINVGSILKWVRFGYVLRVTVDGWSLPMAKDLVIMFSKIYWGGAMSAGALGYAVGGALIMFVLFLIFLGLPALIHPLRHRFGLRNVLAWFLSSIFVAKLSGSVGGDITLLFVASIFSALAISLRYAYITRKITTGN